MRDFFQKLKAVTTATMATGFFCSCYLVGCGGPSTSPGLAAGLPQADTGNAAPVELRLPSGSSSEFLPEQPGSDFASDLQYSRCDSSGDSAVYSPAWPGTGSSTAADAAFAVYALELDAALSSAVLTLSWQGGFPNGNCWVGLPDWSAQAWKWALLPASGMITVSDPAMFADASNHTFAAVVLLGTTPAQLDLIGFGAGEPDLSYPVVDTNQAEAYDDLGNVVNPLAGQAFYGQDSQYDGYQPSYTDNGDGTVTDNVTGLVWAQSPNAQTKLAFNDSFTYAAGLTLGGHSDWRVPTIKELYSLIDFTGLTGMTEGTSIPFIDTDYFDFEYGDESAGERYIDAQYWSSTEYVSTTMAGDPTVFGVNFADGRIKGYPKLMPGSSGLDKLMFIRCVRGNLDYGVNNFVDNGDGTITDQATGLTWMEQDSGHLNAAGAGDGGLNWQAALAWAEGLDYADETDWRLPSAKELQSLIDYTRSPDTTSSAAINPVFQCSAILDEGGSTNFPFYWTNTTHLDGPQPGDHAAYLCFGEALGFMESPPGSGSYELWDVHGAGAQRSDPKDGDPADYPLGHGPQGDVIRIFNYVRCVRN